VPYYRTQAAALEGLTEQAITVLRRQENASTAELLMAFRTAQDQMNARLGAVFASLGTDTWDVASMRAAGRLQLTLQEFDAIIRQLARQSVVLIQNGWLDQWHAAIQRSTYILDQALPEGIDALLPSIPLPNVTALMNSPYIGGTAVDRLAMVSDFAAAGIRRELMQSMINGETMQAAAKRLVPILGAQYDSPTGYFYDALRIARTEIMRAQNYGRMAVYSANSEVLEGDPEDAWEWVTTPDDQLCRWCLRRDGLSPDEIEDDGEDPHGKSMELPLHPNCRCTSVPKLKAWGDLLDEKGIELPEDWGDDVRGMRDADGDWRVQPVETFTEWADRRQAELAA
jgi:hypothetical protein